MARIDLENIPQRLYDELAIRAAREHKTIAQEAISLLELSILDTKTIRERRAKAIHELKEITWPKTSLDVVTEIRKDRDER